MKKIIFASILLISIPLSVACSSLPAASTAEPSIQTTTVNDVPILTPEASDGTLSDQQISDLRYMREEEKLAHDVYAYFYGLWGLPVFDNIASSEATHTASILTLLNRYGIADPAAGMAAGEFQNTELQLLYNSLIEQGSSSLGAALKVGAAIEEIDITDLEATSAHTSQPDILLIYENLMAGSANHLRAFTGSLLQQTGETYQPQYLPVDEYQAILDGSNSAGMGFGAQGQGGARGQGRSNRF